MVLLYDGSLEGFFTAVFEANKIGSADLRIQRNGRYKPELFEEVQILNSNPVDARRVLKGIVKILGKRGLNLITRAFLSEKAGCEDLIHRFIRKGMRAGIGIIDDLTDPDALGVMQMSQKTMKEYHRFLGLIRFQKLSTGEYYAPFGPDTNLIPLLGRHFASRFPDQPWMIHDKKRNTALLHIRGKLEIISLEDHDILTKDVIKEINSSEASDPWAGLWKIYHERIAIEERANPKLQMNFMPKKHWIYLTEMN